ncbi:MAG: hypothetical protein IH983_13045 [Planctomycetes bacterium]|nr:hypothetical protein [Planctomycetota bacterium]
MIGIILKTLGIGCVVLATVILAGWLMGRVISDRFGWSQWLLWIPTPAVLLATLLGLAGASRPAKKPRLRRRRLGIWAAIGAAIGLYFTTIEHRFWFRAAVTDVPGLRVVHWNMSHEKRGRYDAHVEKILELGGDLTILSHSIGTRRSERLQAWLGESAKPVMVRPFTVLTRLPILEARALIANDDILVAMFQIDTSDHLGQPITVYAVDFPSDLRRSRAEVARTVRRLLQDTSAPPPDIVVGDFNMTRGSASLRMLFPDLEHAYNQAGHGYGASFHRAIPLFHLDHVLLADTVRASTYELIDPQIGRHLVQVLHVAANR